MWNWFSFGVGAVVGSGVVAVVAIMCALNIVIQAIFEARKDE